MASSIAIEKDGRQYWGCEFDAAIAAICLETPMYTISRGAAMYRRFPPRDGKCTFVDDPSSEITDNNIVLVNRQQKPLGLHQNIQEVKINRTDSRRSY